MSHAPFAAALLDPTRAAPAGLRAWNGSDPARRLAVHRNNVVSSLIDALADSFAVVQQLVGEVFFRAMAGEFVRQAPPRSCVLAHYGLARDELTQTGPAHAGEAQTGPAHTGPAHTGPDFAAFIEQFAPAQSLPYLADVARLEAARVRACHAADADALSPEAVARALASGDHVGQLQVGLHPSVCLLRSRYAVVSLWAAHQGDGADEAIGRVDVDRPEQALVLRHGLEVLVLPLAQGPTAFVDALLQRQSLGVAAQHAASADALNFDLRSTLALLLSHGAMSALHLPHGQTT